MIDVSTITHCPICKTKLQVIKDKAKCFTIFNITSGRGRSHFSFSDLQIDYYHLANENPSFHYYQSLREEFYYYTPDGKEINSSETFSSVEEFIKHSLLLIDSFLFL